MNRMDTGDLLGQPNNMLGGNLALASRGSINTSGRLHANETGISSDSTRGKFGPEQLYLLPILKGFHSREVFIVTEQ